MTKISELLDGFTGVVVNLKAEASAQSIGAPGVAAPSNDFSVDSPAIFPALLSPKAEAPSSNPAKLGQPTAASSNTAGSALASQKAVEVEVTSLHDTLPAVQTAATPQQLGVNLRAPAPRVPPVSLQSEADSRADAGHHSATMPFHPTDTTANTNLSDQTTGDQARPREQSESSTTENTAVLKVVSSSFANPATVDPSKSLVTANPFEIPASHNNLPATPAMPAVPVQPPATLTAWQDYQDSAGKVVSSAWLNASANGAEMHVELRSGNLGPLGVHASVQDGSVGAEIHVEGREAHAILAAGLPSLEKALGEQNLRVGNVAVYQDHVGAGMSGGGRQNSHPGSSPTPQQHQNAHTDPNAQPGSPSIDSLEVESVANPTAGFSVRA